MASRASADRPILSLVVDRSAARGRLEDTIEAAARAGVDWVQLRERRLEGEAWLAFADSLAAAARRGRSDVCISVNRRIDVALCLGVDAVHLGFDAVAVGTARALLGEQARIGVSAHTPDEVRAARAAGADYAHLAPIYAPRSKPASRPPLGLAALRAAARAGIPVIAQGGLCAERCGEAIAAGAAGVAVTGAILMGDDPAAETRRLREALDGAR